VVGRAVVGRARERWSRAPPPPSSPLGCRGPASRLLHVPCVQKEEKPNVEIICLALPYMRPVLGSAVGQLPVLGANFRPRGQVRGAAEGAGQRGCRGGRSGPPRGDPGGGGGGQGCTHSPGRAVSTGYFSTCRGLGSAVGPLLAARAHCRALCGSLEIMALELCLRAFRATNYKLHYSINYRL
jgi:hypothetical protein